MILMMMMKKNNLLMNINMNTNMNMNSQEFFTNQEIRTTTTRMKKNITLLQPFAPGFSSASKESALTPLSMEPQKVEHDETETDGWKSLPFLGDEIWVFP